MVHITPTRCRYLICSDIGFIWPNKWLGDSKLMEATGYAPKREGLRDVGISEVSSRILFIINSWIIYLRGAYTNLGHK